MVGVVVLVCLLQKVSLLCYMSRKEGKNEEGGMFSLTWASHFSLHSSPVVSSRSSSSLCTLAAFQSSAYFVCVYVCVYSIQKVLNAEQTQKLRHNTQNIQRNVLINERKESVQSYSRPYPWLNKYIRARHLVHALSVLPKEGNRKSQQKDPHGPRTIHARTGYPHVTARLKFTFFARSRALS